MTDRAPLTNAQRQKLFRDRERDGLMVLRNVPVPRLNWPCTLNQLGYLAVEDMNNPRAIAKATERFIEETATVDLERWLENYK